jgi:hypothetical protein
MRNHKGKSRRGGRWEEKGERKQEKEDKRKNRKG